MPVKWTPAGVSKGVEGSWLRYNRRADEARERLERARMDSENAQLALQQLHLGEMEQDRFTSLSHQVMDPPTSLTEKWLSQQRQANLKSNQESPDDWIDQYSAGLLPPSGNKQSSRSAVSAELDPFNGKALEWFRWIDLFRALLHDTPKTPGEKLALLKRPLKEECLDVVYGLGGGEQAYIQTLVRLKESYGRRDVMRAAHVQALDRLELKGEPGAFKRFAEKVRTHLFDLNRIGETSTTDIIERVCLTLNLHDRLAWNENRHGSLEQRRLNDFGRWLCARAAAYQNAYSIAENQINSSSTSKGFYPRRAKTNHASTETSDGGDRRPYGKPYCFKCEKGHRLAECDEFKLLSVGERVNFCMRRRLCFSCFGCKHSVRECPSMKPCKQPGCSYTHHSLLHDDKRSPAKDTRTCTARSDGFRSMTLGMLRLKVQNHDRSWRMANVFIDEGSDTTLMRSAFAVALNIQGHSQVLTVDGAGGLVTRHRSKRVQFQILTPDGDVVMLEGSTMKLVASPTPITDWSQQKLQWPHLRDLPVGEVGGKVDILIGTDYLHLLAAQETREGTECEPIASKTRLGWIVRGVTNKSQHVTAIRSFTISGHTPLDNLSAEIRWFCDTEDFGTEYSKGCISSDDQRALTITKEKTRRLAVGYEVPIIWREGDPDLINNQQMVKNRFQSLLRRFQTQPELERDYEAAMQKNLDQGYASRIQDPVDVNTSWPITECTRARNYASCLTPPLPSRVNV